MMMCLQLLLCSAHQVPAATQQLQQQHCCHPEQLRCAMLTQACALALQVPMKLLFKAWCAPPLFLSL